MLKFASVLALVLISLVALFVSATIENAPRLSSSSSSLKLGGGDIISLQRCNGTCTSSFCETIVEFQANKCHPPLRRGLFDHGEILSCHPAPVKKQCVVETIFDNHLHTGPNCDPSAKFESAPRELGVCTQDVFGDPLKFFKYDQAGNSGIQMYRDCDYGCHNCQVIVPLTYGQCKDLPAHAFFRDWTFQVAAPQDCSGAIKRDMFRFDGCDGEPIYTETVFTDKCYDFGGHSHRYLCGKN